MKRYTRVIKDGEVVALKPKWWDMLFALPMYLCVLLILKTMPNHSWHGIKFKDWCLQRTLLMRLFDFIGWEMIALIAMLLYWFFNFK